MAMKRCAQDLHFYDPDKNPNGCPYCRDMSDNDEATVAHFPARSSEISDDGVTIGLFKKKAGFEPVVGWLVCIEGKYRGKDFRIKPGINTIGRNDESTVDIVLSDDSMISRTDHAEIEYDSEENAFYLSRKRNPAVRLNGSAVRQPTSLTSHDVIQFGESLFIFVPLCTEQFKWVIGEPAPRPLPGHSQRKSINGKIEE